MLLRHGKRLFRVSKQVRNTSLLFLMITMVEGILWYLLPMYFYAQLNDIMLVGLVISGYSIASVLADLPAGDLSDHLGRKFVFIIGLIGAILAFALLMFGTFHLLLFAMILYGAFSTFYYTSSLAHVLDNSKEEDVGRNAGIFTMCSDAGWTLGPLLSGVVLYFLDAPQVLIMTIFCFLFFIWLGHNHISGSDKMTRKKFKEAEHLLVKDRIYVTELKRLSTVGKPLLYIFLFSFAVGVWELIIWTLEPLYVASQGHSIFLGGLALGLLTLPFLLFDYISGLTCDKYGVGVSIIIGLFGVILGHIIFFTQSSLALMFVGLVIAAIGIAFMWMPIDVIIRQKVQRDLRAEAVGFSDTAYGVGGIFAPLLVGSIATIDNFVIPFYVTFALFIVAGLVFFFFARKG